MSDWTNETQSERQINLCNYLTRKPYGFMQSSFWVSQSLWWFNVMVRGGLYWFVVIRGGSWWFVVVHSGSWWFVLV